MESHSKKAKVKMEVEEGLHDCWRCDLHATKQALRKHDVQCMLKYNEENPEQYRPDQPAPEGLLKIVTNFTKKFRLSISAINEFFGVLHDYQLSNELLSPKYAISLIPKEIQILILAYLDSKDLLNMQAASTGFYDIVNSEALCKIHFAKRFPRSATSRPTDQPSFGFTNWRDDIPFECFRKLGSNTWKTNFMLMHIRKTLEYPTKRGDYKVFDVSSFVYEIHGFHPKARVMTPKGRGIVVGARKGLLHFHIDTDTGATYWDPILDLPYEDYIKMGIYVSD